MEKSEKQKRSGKTKIIIALMFLALMSPKAWGYAEKELPPSFSEDAFSFDDNPSLSRAVLNGSELSEAKFNNDTFSFSRAVLTDEKGVALCQVNLVENPQFLPEFAEPGSSEGLEPLDLPECEEENLDIVAQYAEQAWVKKEVALIPVGVPVAFAAFTGGCAVGLMTWIIADTRNGDDIPSVIERQRINDLASIVGGIYGLSLNLFTGLWAYGRNPAASNLISMTGWKAPLLSGMSAGLSVTGGIVCSSIVDRIAYE